MADSGLAEMDVLSGHLLVQELIWVELGRHCCLPITIPAFLLLGESLTVRSLSGQVLRPAGPFPTPGMNLY